MRVLRIILVVGLLVGALWMSLLFIEKESWWYVILAYLLTFSLAMLILFSSSPPADFFERLEDDEPDA